MILEDQPKNLWSRAVGELLARYAYGFERAFENFRGPANDKMKPGWVYFETHRVDEMQTKLVQAEKRDGQGHKKEDGEVFALPDVLDQTLLFLVV